jgi:DNA-binding SARP family transcriptional activator
VAASLGFAGFAAGIPALLSVTAGWPLPRHLPGITETGAALSAGWRPEAEVVVKTFAAIGWVIWAQIAASVAVELRSSRSGRAASAVPLAGWCQPLAVRLAATILTLMPAIAPRAAGAATPPVPVPVVVAVAGGEAPPVTALAPPPTEVTVTPAPPPVEEASVPATVAHTVCAGDTLWDLAAHHLDDPLRWQELFELNRGRPQPDGRHLDDPGLLRPGWRIELPAPTILRLPASETHLDPATPTGADVLPSALDASSASADADLAVATPPPSVPDGQAAASPPEGAAVTQAELAGPPGADDAVPDASATEPDADPDAPPDAPASRTVIPASGTAEAAQPVSEPSGTPSSTGEGDGGLDGSHVTVGVPALVAGAFLGYLGGLRRDRERWRRRHHRFPIPGPEQLDAERQVRAVPGAEAVTWVDLAMRHLASVLAEEGAPPPPDILAVRAGALGVEVLVARPWPVAPGRFVAVDDGQTWRLDPAVDLDELAELARGVPSYLPALITLGETGSGGVLVDLDHLGSLVVTGDTERVRAVLESIALELATAPWADAVEVCLIGVGGPLAGLERARILDPDEAVATLRREAELPSGAGLAAAATCDIPPAPTVAIIGAGALEAKDLDALLGVAQPHSGLAVVAACAGTSERWQLAVAGGGEALLSPLGLALTVNTRPETAETLQSILGDTAARGTDAPEPTADTDIEPNGEHPSHAETVAAQEDTEAQADTDEPASSPAPPLVDVRVLGPVEITWPRETPRPQVGELVAYLATHPPAVGAERARLALWPATTDDDRFGERHPGTFWNLTSKARKVVGADKDGKPLLLRDSANAFSLAPSVGCDWVTFSRLTADARRQSPDAAALLRQALTLVRGRPFQDPPPGYAWVELERLDNEIEAAVVDAALDLVDLALAAADVDTARWAIRQGFLAVPHSEPLLRATMRTAAATGDRAGVERAWQDARRLAAEIDPTCEPEPDTVALYRELRSSRRGT